MRKGLKFILVVVGIGLVSQLANFVKANSLIDIFAWVFIVFSCVVLIGFFIRQRNESK